MSPEEIPTLLIRPGMPVAEVERSAGLRLNHATLFDNSAITINRPIRMVYADRQHGFELPPSRFVFLPQRAGTITGIETTPALAYMDLRSAHESALAVMDRLRTAGWIATDAFINDFAAIERLNREKNPGEELRKLYGGWRLATVSATVYVKEHSTPASGLPGPQFLPAIDIMDWRLQKEMENKMFDRREAVNKTINKSLPLSEWVK